MSKFWNDHWSERFRRELALRNYSDATCRSYLQVLSAFLASSPGDPRKQNRDNICAYLGLLHGSAGLSASTRNLHRYAMTFFFRHVLRQAAPVSDLPHAKGTQKLPDARSKPYSKAPKPRQAFRAKAASTRCAIPTQPICPKTEPICATSRYSWATVIREPRNGTRACSQATIRNYRARWICSKKRRNEARKGFHLFPNWEHATFKEDESYRRQNP